MRAGVLVVFLGVPRGPENPISDQNIQFSLPYFRPDSQNVYPTSDPVRCGNFGNSRVYGIRDFVTPQTISIAFSLLCAITHFDLRYSDSLCWILDKHS